MVEKQEIEVRAQKPDACVRIVHHGSEGIATMYVYDLDAARVAAECLFLQARQAGRVEIDAPMFVVLKTGFQGCTSITVNPDHLLIGEFRVPANEFMSAAHQLGLMPIIAAQHQYLLNRSGVA